MLQAVVRLPQTDATQQAGNQTQLTHTRINITETDTVQKAIQNCLSKCKGLGDTDYILKASGFACLGCQSHANLLVVRSNSKQSA